MSSLPCSRSACGLFAVAFLLSIGSAISATAQAHPAKPSAAKPAKVATPPAPVVDPWAAPHVARHATPRDAEIRAIYLTGLMAGTEHGRQIAEAWRAEGGNAVVFDIKDSDGPVSFNASSPLAGHMRVAWIRDLPAYVNWLHAHGLYAIARQAVFKDERLVKEHPELAIQSRANGGVWLENKKAVWTDPSLPAVQDYNISLATEVAAAGVDEIQFDYIRFPTEGAQKDARFHYQASEPEALRTEFISNFLYRAQQALKPSGVHLSIDVFGVTAWARDVDVNSTGQDIVSLSYFCDVLCPMIYPSHFFGNFDGVADPGDAPAHFIQAGMQKFNHITQDTGAVIRPWLQAFAWHAKTFGPDYIKIQIETERAEHGGGFMLWNANNVYKAPAEAMPEMNADAAKYFQGGFPYADVATAAPAGAH